MVKMLCLVYLVIRFFDLQPSFKILLFSVNFLQLIFPKNVHRFVIFYSNGYCIFGSNSALMYKIQANKDYISLWSVTDRMFLIKNLNRLCVSCLSLKEIKLHTKLADQIIEFMCYQAPTYYYHKLRLLK